MVFSNLLLLKWRPATEQPTTDDLIPMAAPFLHGKADLVDVSSIHPSGAAAFAIKVTKQLHVD